MATPIALIAGLGNPGARYAGTRHNAGYLFVEAAARRCGASLTSSRFAGLAGELHVDGRRCRLLQPQTFMNESGRSVAAMAAFYRIEPAAILVVHDDLDLSPGAVRLKAGGGHGGHNGLRDIVARLGSAGFVRLRLGIGRPPPGGDVTAYVLSRGPRAEQEALEAAVDRALEQLPGIVAGDHARVMNVLHADPASDAS